MYISTCNSYIPSNGSGYQYPKSGNAVILSTFYCKNCGRGYLKNRLKKNLEGGKTYCVKFYINIVNVSPRGMDGFGAYLSDNMIDTISKCNLPLSYLTPQVKNALGNVISDTLNWTPITGTFVATGIEKYLLLGNFLPDNAVSTISINPAYYPQDWTDVLIDDVSCTEINLPAYAGPDQSLIPGDSVYIGRENDFAIDPGCRWYQFPNMATPIDTISGMWVKPSVTTTYIVRQILDCSAEKWDTVMVYMKPLGIVNLSAVEDDIKLFPNPASDFLEIFVSNPELLKDFKTLSIYNNLGQLVREEDMAFIGKKISVKTTDLKDGMYFIRIGSVNSGTVSKRFVIAR